MRRFDRRDSATATIVLGVLLVLGCAFIGSVENLLSSNIYSFTPPNKWSTFHWSLFGAGALSNVLILGGLWRRLRPHNG